MRKGRVKRRGRGALQPREWDCDEDSNCRSTVEFTLARYLFTFKKRASGETDFCQIRTTVLQKKRQYEEEQTLGHGSVGYSKAGHSPGGLSALHTAVCPAPSGASHRLPPNLLCALFQSYL